MLAAAIAQGRRGKAGSRFRGVHWQRDPRYRAGGYWRAIVTVHGKQITRKAMSEEVAAERYNELARTHFGAAARLNRIVR